MAYHGLTDLESEWLRAAEKSLRVAKRKSLRAAKRIAKSTKEFKSSDLTDEDFKRIKELKAKQARYYEALKYALCQHGLLRKRPAFKRVNPSVLETNIRRKMTKEERLELVKAGREDRGKYQARAAIKQKKTGGTSNEQKEYKKIMLEVAKRAKIARSRQESKRLNPIAGKQFTFLIIAAPKQYRC